MPILLIPTPLRSYSNGLSEVSVLGNTVGIAMADFVSQFPDLKPHLFNGHGQLRPFVNLFLGGKNIRDLNGLETPVQEDDRIFLVPSIAGG